MFLGQYSHKLDDKGRLSIPAKFREDLGSGAYLIQGFDGNLRLLTDLDFGKLTEKINGMNQADQKVRALQRFIFANASRVEFDRNGRALVPKFLQDFAGIVNDAVVVGVGDGIEIWSPEIWEEQQSLLQEAAANNQLFAELDLSL